MDTNPTRLAETLLEEKYDVFEELRTSVYGMQAWARKQRGGSQSQLSMRQFLMDEPVVLTEHMVGLCAPGHALIRHFFLALSTTQATYKFSWRQQNVTAEVA